MRLLSIAICFLLTGALLAQESFEFNDEKIKPGTKAHFTIPIAGTEGETFIPITVFHGSKEGPVLGLTAGVHGYEYSPILAGQQLIEKIDPAKLSGTVILVQVANMGSFLGRSPFTNPMDDKNLNRTFPGSPDGTITERIAHYITSSVIPRCEFFVDMHSGDAPEDLLSYLAIYKDESKKEISERSHGMAMSMWFDRIIVINAADRENMKEGSSSLYCSAEAFKQGLPTVAIECGRLGIIEDEKVEQVTLAILNLLKHLGMNEGNVTPKKGTMFITDRSYISSSLDGIFYPLKSGGDYIEKGMKLGYVTDFFGKVIQEVYTEHSGVIMYIIGTPPVNKGETLVSIGIVK